MADSRVADRFYKNGCIEIEGQSYYAGVPIITSEEDATQFNNLPFSLAALKQHLEFIKYDITKKNEIALTKNLIYFLEESPKPISTQNMPQTTAYTPKTIAEIKALGFKEKSNQMQPPNISKNDILLDAYVYKLYAESSKKITLLNPANDQTILGGAFIGSNGLEELIAKCSNFAFAILFYAWQFGIPYVVNSERNTARPLYAKIWKESEALYTSDVTFHQVLDRNQNFKACDEFQVDVLSAAAIYYQSLKQAQMDFLQGDGKARIKYKIRGILTAAIMNHSDIIMIPAWGCGQYHNDPFAVAQCFWDVLYEENYALFFEEIYFSLWTDPQAENKYGNYAVFEKTFKDNEGKLLELNKKILADNKANASPYLANALYQSDEKTQAETVNEENNNKLKKA